ncbi:MAG: site-specific DNA-methyltransferase [Planctomycetota bacterium]
MSIDLAAPVLPETLASSDPASTGIPPRRDCAIRLIHGKTPEALLDLDERFDLLLTDPPYNSKRKSCFALSWQKHQNRDFGPWDASENVDYSWLAPVVTRLLAENAAILIFSPFERLGDYEAALASLGCTYKTAIVWHKTNGVVHVPAYKSSCEAIVYAIKGRPFFRRWETQKAFAAHNFIEGASCMGNERRLWDHPTQKPEYVLTRLLLRHSRPGDWVLDPFMGVGSVPASCFKNARNCVGVELDPLYYKKSLLRLRALTETFA